MSGEKNRKMQAPVLTSMMMERAMIQQLDRQVARLGKKHGFKISRSDLIRQVLENYIQVTGG